MTDFCQETFAKKRTSIKGQLIGIHSVDPNCGADVALKCISFIEDIKKDELRKDGSPGITHEYDGISMIMGLSLDYKSKIELVILYSLHDAVEDYSIRIEDVPWMSSERFARIVMISKIRYGVKLSHEEYFGGMTDPFVIVANLNIVTGKLGIDVMFYRCEETRTNKRNPGMDYSDREETPHYLSFVGAYLRIAQDNHPGILQPAEKPD